VPVLGRLGILMQAAARYDASTGRSRGKASPGGAAVLDRVTQNPPYAEEAGDLASKICGLLEP
jgi:hypothetical protein